MQISRSSSRICSASLIFCRQVPNESCAWAFRLEPSSSVLDQHERLFRFYRIALVTIHRFFPLKCVFISRQASFLSVSMLLIRAINLQPGFYNLITCSPTTAFSLSTAQFLFSYFLPRNEFSRDKRRFGLFTRFFSTYAPCFLLSLSTSLHELHDSLYGLFFHPRMSAIYRLYHMISPLCTWWLFFARIEVILYSITSFYSGLLLEILFCFCLWFQFIPSLFSCHSTRSCLINEFLR